MLSFQISKAEQSPGKSTRQEINQILGFEIENGETLPVGWRGTPEGTVVADNTIVHSGKWSARLSRTNSSPGKFSSISVSLPIDFTGHTIALRGFIRTDGVHDYAALWLRQDGEEGVLSIDNMQHRQIKGTTDWAEYTVTLQLDPAATTLVFGGLLSGEGQAWLDDLKLTVDGKSVEEAEPLPIKAEIVLDRVHDFDRGSGLQITDLSFSQIENLAVLCRVWGFLKYHDQAVTAGYWHWDYELLRIMPSVLTAKNAVQRNSVLMNWISTIDSVDPPSGPRHTEVNSQDIALRADVGWIDDQATLGKALSLRLRSIYDMRNDSPQFYVSIPPGAGNPLFDHELQYPKLKFPDSGFQLLGLFRFWNILQYWSPNRIVAQEDWPQVLQTFIPKVALAADKTNYQLAMMAFAARVQDTHTNIWNSLNLRPPAGTCQVPVNVRFINGKAVISGYATSQQGIGSDFMIGDIIEQIDGESLSKMMQTWAPLYADSNQPARLRDMALTLTRGDCKSVTITVQRHGQSIAITADRLPRGAMDRIDYTHDLPGDTFRLLSQEVAYLKLSTVKAENLEHYLALAQGTKGMIVDIRNYPSEFVVFALGQHLVTQPTPFASFTYPQLGNPGLFVWGHPVNLTPKSPAYEGKVVILVDEISQSQAEYTAMALRTAPGAIVVGSTTAGADGNVSEVPLPGQIQSMISGIGVFYPDRRPTQRIGIVPDIIVTPTIEGLKSDRDEVLETAVRQILGMSVLQSDLEKMTRH
jgi:Peptidase family S41